MHKETVATRVDTPKGQPIEHLQLKRRRSASSHLAPIERIDWNWAVIVTHYRRNHCDSSFTVNYFGLLWVVISSSILRVHAQLVEHFPSAVLTQHFYEALLISSSPPVVTVFISDPRVHEQCSVRMHSENAALGAIQCLVV